ncbi:MAG TPA: hypothetical protein VGN37_08190 [Actinocatenispora sp.]
MKFPGADRVRPALPRRRGPHSRAPALGSILGVCAEAGLLGCHVVEGFVGGDFPVEHEAGLGAVQEVFQQVPRGAQRVQQRRARRKQRPQHPVSLLGRRLFGLAVRVRYLLSDHVRVRHPALPDQRGGGQQAQHDVARRPPVDTDRFDDQCRYVDGARLDGVGFGEHFPRFPVVRVAGDGRRCDQPVCRRHAGGGRVEGGEQPGRPERVRAEQLVGGIDLHG